MSHKNLTIGTIVVFCSITAVVTLLAMTSMLQGVNAFAAVTALTVTLIGMALFKRTSH